MANRIKLKGTSERSFDIGLGPKQTFDANNLTANRTWVLPDSNGTAGYVLSTDGTGNLSWAAGGSISSQARIEFTAASNGTGQTFTDANLATFTNNTYANVFVNGVLLQTSEYSISGTTLTVSRYLSTGDNIIVAATVAAGTPPTTKQYLHALRNGTLTYTLPAASIVIPDNVNISSGISYNTTTGAISLTAGKIYKLTGLAQSSGFSASQWYFVDFASSTILVAGTTMRGPAAGSVVTELLYSPVSNQTVALYFTMSGGGNVIVTNPNIIVQEL